MLTAIVLDRFASKTILLDMSDPCSFYLKSFHRKLINILINNGTLVLQNHRESNPCVHLPQTATNTINGHKRIKKSGTKIISLSQRTAIIL